MIWSFNCFEKVGDAVIAQPRREAHLAWRYHKVLSGLRIAAGNQALAEQSVDRPLEGSAGTSLLLLDEHSEVVVDGESGPHIMMLSKKAS